MILVATVTHCCTVHSFFHCPFLLLSLPPSCMPSYSSVHPPSCLQFHCLSSQWQTDSSPSSCSGSSEVGRWVKKLWFLLVGKISPKQPYLFLLVEPFFFFCWIGFISTLLPRHSVFKIWQKENSCNIFWF